MNGTREREPAESAEDGGRLDPRAAAALREQTRAQAQRRLDMRSPGLSLLGAVVVLAAFGAVWLSVRGQHPYTGPTAAGLLVMYGILVGWIAVVATAHRRATTGLSGRSIRQQRAYGAVGLTALVGVSVFQGVLKQDGVSHAIVYGVMPAAGPLIVIGTTRVGIAAVKADWPQFGAALVVIVAGIVAAFVGPSGAWLAAGIGLLVAVEGYAVATRHRPIDLGGPPPRSIQFVSTMPGTTQFTRTSGASATARRRVSWITPALETE